MASIDSGVSLQADTLSTVPGGPIRTAGVFITVGGLQTQVQQQVVTLADKNGVLVGDQFEPLLASIADSQLRTLVLLADLRTMLGFFTGMPIVDNNVAISGQPTFTL